jgi:hypothetical protein
MIARIAPIPCSSEPILCSFRQEYKSGSIG